MGRCRFFHLVRIQIRQHKNSTYTRDYTFKKVQKKFIVEVDLWTDLEKTEVPFNVTVPLAR